MRRRVVLTVVGFFVFASALAAAQRFLGDDNSVHRSPAAPATTAVLDGSDCLGDPARPVVVPDLRGLPLGDALIAARTAGLHVVGTGTPAGDLTGSSATVRAQKPPAGIRVPVGACLGFRTGS